MENSMRKMMGDAPYNLAGGELDMRAKNRVTPTPSAVKNEGRPKLPLLIGNARRSVPSREVRSPGRSAKIWVDQQQDVLPFYGPLRPSHDGVQRRHHPGGVRQ